MSKGYYLPDEGKDEEFKKLREEEVKSEDRGDYTKAWEMRKIIKEMRNKLEDFRKRRKSLREELNPSTAS